MPSSIIPDLKKKISQTIIVLMLYSLMLQVPNLVQIDTILISPIHSTSLEMSSFLARSNVWDYILISYPLGRVYSVRGSEYFHLPKARVESCYATTIPFELIKDRHVHERNDQLLVGGSGAEELRTDFEDYQNSAYGDLTSSSCFLICLKNGRMQITSVFSTEL